MVVDEPRKDERKKRLRADDFALLEALTELSEVSFEYPKDAGGYVRGPDPYTREIGRLAYLELVRSRNPNDDAEVAYERADKKLHKITKKAGNDAQSILGIKGIDPAILFLVGKLLTGRVTLNHGSMPSRRRIYAASWRPNSRWT